MQVVGIEIENFRGIRATCIERCGALNVLIGKNNSGKSTVLDAIDAFFNVVGAGSAVSIDPPIGLETDFHRHPEAGPINISVVFSLTDEEQKQLANEISDDAPQMKRAVEDLPDGLLLRVSISVPRARRRFSYVSGISLVDEAFAPTHSRVLLEVSPAAASELAERAIEIRRGEWRAREIQEAAYRIDPSDFSAVKERGMRGIAPGRSFSRLGGNPEITFEIESVIRSSTDFDEFRRTVEAITTSELDLAKRTRESPLENPVATFAGEEAAVPAYGLHLLERIGSIQILHLRDRRQPVGREEAKRLLALKVRRGGPEVLRAIQETVHSLLGVNIDAFESPVPGPRNESSAEMDVDEFLVEMNGAGIREALRLVLDNELSSPDILLVEEPEVHLHPALETSMLRYLKAASERSQIFVTTHSTNFLDTADMRNVYLVTKPTTTMVKLLDYEEAEISIPAELGIRLSSLFMHDRLVFVEGLSDEAILRELASVLQLNLSRANVGFVAMGGVRNFTHYATQATLEFLHKRNVQLTFILDRDEATDAEISEFTARFDTSTKVHVLARREIENYLIVSRAIATLIVQKAQNAGQGEINPASADVEKLVHECAAELKDTVTDKRIARLATRPLALSRAAILDTTEITLIERVEAEVRRLQAELSQTTDVIREQIATESAAVERDWRDKSLAIVPGDELLDCVFRHHGLRFKKERDGARLASLLNPQDIPRELVELLEFIAGDSSLSN